MKPLLQYYGRFAGWALGGSFLGVLIFQLSVYGKPPGTDYARFEVWLAFAAGVLAVACVDGDRDDARLEYLWSLPVHPRQIFFSKVVLSVSLLLSIYLIHAVIEGFQLFWFLDRALPKAPYEVRPHAFRPHPLTLIFGAFPLCLLLGESNVLRRFPRRLFWPLLFVIPMLGPWLLLSATYTSILPPPPAMTFYRLPEGTEGNSLLERYNNSCVIGGALYWQYWGIFLGVAFVLGLLMLHRAASNYAGRLISPEGTEE